VTQDCRSFFGWFFGFAFLEKFKLRLSCACKLRLSGVAFCVLGCFFDLGFEPFCGLRLLGLGAGLAGGFLWVVCSVWLGCSCSGYQNQKTNYLYSKKENTVSGKQSCKLK
jgi:hypothetical protein